MVSKENNVASENRKVANDLPPKLPVIVLYRPLDQNL